MKTFTLFMLLVLLFFLHGCGNNSDEYTAPAEVLTGEAYIYSIPDDTTPVSNLKTTTTPPASIPLLVLLLEYDNQQIVSSDATWHDKFFGNGDAQLNGYLNEVSNSQCSFTPADESYGTANDGIIKVHLNRDHFDTNNASGDLAADLNASINDADAYIDFSLYDSDYDGSITPRELTIIVVIAGYEEAYEGSGVANGVWAHQWALYNSYIPTVDGVSVFDGVSDGKYAVFGELHGSDNPHDATIGVIIHELGHATFDLPDLYNTANSSIGGIGAFGLMGSGSWARKDANEYPGDTPTHMTAWSKSYLGWVTPQEYSNTTVTLDATDLASYNVVKIPISANHYYLIENRNNSGFDRGLASITGDFQGGLAIWHINNTKLTEDNFRSNNVNADTSDKGVDLVEAVDATLDTNGGMGSASALFFNANREHFGEKVTNIPNPSANMTIEIN